MQALRLEQKQLQSHQPLEDDQLELMTANLLKIKREITQRNQNTNPLSSSSNPLQPSSLSPLKPAEMSDTRTTEISEQIKQKYQQFLSAVHDRLPKNHEQKLEYLLQKQQMCMGVAVALFQMLYYFREVISQEVVQEITDKAFLKIVEQGNKIILAEKHAYLELIAICGIYKEEIAAFVVEEMLEGRLDFVLSFVVLSNLGYKGLELLVNLAKQDFKQTPILILNYLARTEQILKSLIVPTLVQDLSSAKSKGKQKDMILSILNRLNETISSSPQLLPLLAELMSNNINDRGLIASVLRAAGPQGEEILLEMIVKYWNNDKIMLPVVNVLSWRPPIEPVLRMKVIEYTLINNFLPGRLYQYEGNIESSAFCFEQDQCCDSLCLNARDFIAALNRMLSYKLEQYENQQFMRSGSSNNIRLFTLYEVIGKAEEQKSNQISAEVIRSLMKCLHNPKPEIREAAINSLGLIGLPQAFESIEEVSKCLWDKDNRVRSMACGTLSQICEHPNKKIVNRLIELLKDNFWKVRISACICIGAIITEPYQSLVQALVRCLKQNSINKLSLCQTIIKLRGVGQQILLEVLKNVSQHDFKLKQAIICSLREADVQNPHIDFVLEEIFKHCKGTRAQTRINCLETLNFLRLKAAEQEQNIVYLKAKTILPFYYHFLQDPSLKIREMATDSIFSFGGQAELIFIQGIAKGSQMVRIQSAKGLAKLGIQNFRALILGLRDEDPQVRQTTCTVILNTFTPEDVVTYYSTKAQQMPSLLCNLKDILSGGGLSPAMRNFIKQTIMFFEKSSKGQTQQLISISDSKNQTRTTQMYEDLRRR